jgi:hypothetical protein
MAAAGELGFAARPMLGAAPAIAALLASCFDPQYQDPQCGPGGDCPTGLLCSGGAVGICVKTLPDALPTDAAPFQNEPDDAAVDAPVDAAIDDAAPDAEPDAAPDASPGRCRPTWVPILGNGGFESGRTIWTEAPAPRQVIRQENNGLPASAYVGEWAALFGGENRLRQVLTQDVTVPADATEVRIQGYRCIVTEEPKDTRYDWVQLQLVSRDDDTAVIATLGDFDNRGAGADCTWQYFTAVVPLAAGTVPAEMRITSTLDGFSVSSFYFDELVLDAFACPP